MSCQLVVEEGVDKHAVPQAYLLYSTEERAPLPLRALVVDFAVEGRRHHQRRQLTAMRFSTPKLQ